MTIYSYLSRFGYSPIPRRAAVLLVMLASCSLGFGGEIHNAANEGDYEAVKALLKDNPNLVFSKDDYGAMPLHYAAQGGRKDVAELLLANKAEVNAKANNGWTPLHTAEDRGQADVAELLRQHGGQE